MEFFESRIRPIRASECYNCHSATKQKGGLRLDSRDAVRNGGDSGPALIPGNPRQSLLIQFIGNCADDVCVIRSMTLNFSKHNAANYFLHCGSGMAGRPSMGVRTSCGLG